MNYKFYKANSGKLILLTNSIMTVVTVIIGNTLLYDTVHNNYTCGFSNTAGHYTSYVQENVNK